LDADAKIANPYEEVGIANNVRNGGGDSWVDLSWAEDCWILLVVEGYEEDVRDDW
jgi:hypothetical protein